MEELGPASSQWAEFYVLLVPLSGRAPENCTPEVATGNYRVFYIYLHLCLTSRTMTVFIRESCDSPFTISDAIMLRQFNSGKKKNIRESIFKRGSYCIGGGRCIRSGNKYIM